MAGGLMVLIGKKGKKASSSDMGEEADAPADDESSDMDSWLSDAFQALKDDDEAAFKEALKGAIECCQGDD